MSGRHVLQLLVINLSVFVTILEAAKRTHWHCRYDQKLKTTSLKFATGSQIGQPNPKGSSRERRRSETGEDTTVSQTGLQKPPNTHKRGGHSVTAWWHMAKRGWTLASICDLWLIMNQEQLGRQVIGSGDLKRRKTFKKNKKRIEANRGR